MADKKNDITRNSFSFRLQTKDGFWCLSDTDKRLDNYPKRLTDDGMGYGVGEEYFVDVNSQDEYCNLFTEKELDNIDLWNRGKFYPYCSAYIKDSETELTLCDIKEQGDKLWYKNYDDDVWYLEDELEY